MKFSDKEHEIDHSWLFRRMPILTALADRPHTSGELTDRLDHSRTTVYRATAELAERNLIDGTNRGYELTPLGAVIVEQARWFRRSVASAVELRAALDVIDSPLLWRHLSLFADAAVFGIDRGNPYSVTDRLLSLAAEATEWRGVYTSAGVSGVVGRGLAAAPADARVDLVGPRERFERSFENAPGGTDAIADSDRVHLTFVDDVPLEAQTFDDTAVLTGFDPDNGFPTVLIETDDPEAVEWVQKLHAFYRSEGERPESTRQLVS